MKIFLFWHGGSSIFRINDFVTKEAYVDSTQCYHEWKRTTEKTLSTWKLFEGFGKADEKLVQTKQVWCSPRVVSIPGFKSSSNLQHKLKYKTKGNISWNSKILCKIAQNAYYFIPIEKFKNRRLHAKYN